jgi:uncharacterized coiled-coil DUF342 family protein
MKRARIDRRGLPTFQKTGNGVYLLEELNMETTQTIPEWKAAADEIWAILREVGRKHDEIAQQMKETAQRMKETDKRVGEITNRFGDMVEHMVIPNLLMKFGELNFTFTKANRTVIQDKEHNLFTEVDALLENGDNVMAVEIKTKPSIDDIDDHLERMEKLRSYADLHNDKRVYLGAMAGVVFNESEKTYALKKGLYVIEPSGDTFNIIEPKGNYYPHKW